MTLNQSRGWKFFYCVERNLDCLNIYFNLELTLLITFHATFLPESDSSKSTPRYLTDDLEEIWIPLYDIAKGLDFLNIFLEPKRMDSVLPRWIESLLSRSQEHTEFNPQVSLDWISKWFLPDHIYHRTRREASLLFRWLKQPEHINTHVQNAAPPTAARRIYY